MLASARHVVAVDENGGVDDTLYSEGAGPATKAVIVASFLAAAIAGAAWFRLLPSGESFSPSSSRLFSAGVSFVVGLIIGFVAVETLIRRKVVLTRTALQVGRELMPLSRLSLPVLAGERVPETVRSAAHLRHALPSGCRALGDVARAIVGQGAVTIVGSDPGEILVVYSWRPQALAHYLRRALEPSDDSDTADDWPWQC